MVVNLGITFKQFSRVDILNIPIEITLVSKIMEQKCWRQQYIEKSNLNMIYILLARLENTEYAIC